MVPFAHQTRIDKMFSLLVRCDQSCPKFERLDRSVNSFGCHNKRQTVEMYHLLCATFANRYCWILIRILTGIWHTLSTFSVKNSYICSSMWSAMMVYGFLRLEPMTHRPYLFHWKKKNEKKVFFIWTNNLHGSLFIRVKQIQFIFAIDYYLLFNCKLITLSIVDEHIQWQNTIRCRWCGFKVKFWVFLQ